MEKPHMSAYTDARSKPGSKLGGADDRELFVTHAADLVIQAWDQTFEFMGKTMVRTITSGKAEDFPIIGRKRDASDHVPGERVHGGTISHNETTISLDAITHDAVFLAEIDELLNHFPLVAPYSKQLGESLASVSNGRIIRAMILASRVTTAPYPDGPLPSYHFHADMKTDPSKLEDAAFEGVEHIRTNDIGGGMMTYYLPWKQQLLLARYTGIDTVDTSGSGNRSAGTVGQIAGIGVEGVNSIPNTNYTTDSFAKYNGDFSNTVGVISNPMAVGTLKRRGIKTVITEQPDRIGTLMIASQLEGHDKLRPECAFEVANATR
jgi:hypothetical protein